MIFNDLWVGGIGTVRVAGEEELLAGTLVCALIAVVALGNNLNLASGAGRQTRLIGRRDAGRVETPIGSTVVDHTGCVGAVDAHGGSHPNIVLGVTDGHDVRHLRNGLFQFKFIAKGIHRHGNGSEFVTILGNRICSWLSKKTPGPSSFTEGPMPKLHVGKIARIDAMDFNGSQSWTMEVIYGEGTNGEPL